MSTITVVGAGWLGLPLCENLALKGHTVYASRTTEEGKNELSSKGLHAFVSNLNEPASNGLSSILLSQQSEIVVGSFPPGFRKGNSTGYIDSWRNLIAQVRKSNAKKLIMISSTTVYPNLAEDMSEDAASLALAEQYDHFSDNARTMLQAEQLLIDSGLDYVILRCSGLIGPNRNPARFASKLKQISRSAPANMLHLQDAVDIATFAIENASNTILNATTPNCLSKSEFYPLAIEKAKLDDIVLPPIVDIPDKRILCNKLIALGYQFTFDNLPSALDDING
ncbi:NAD(P)H-binding protein [Vibrio sp. SCSIO 43135]|uniref:NAD(P)H-binding protein n=1 Tax=Vibrio sp. SCSIO 43135 TaxID=2819096 RepID=UPI0020760BB3|nr:NAD(P)H-binding protein [Vibrio sp. SCSIO 43135]USD40180.1 NAD(P)H-binding protein [Vibrio sp. SCSIO 43135]